MSRRKLEQSADQKRDGGGKEIKLDAAYLRWVLRWEMSTAETSS